MKDENRRFGGGEIVRLKSDYPDDELKAGDCGVIWGVYADDLYEASFYREDGEACDLMFEEHEVNEVADVGQTPFPERIEEFRNWQMSDDNKKYKRLDTLLQRLVIALVSTGFLALIIRGFLGDGRPLMIALSLVFLLFGATSGVGSIHAIYTARLMRRRNLKNYEKTELVGAYVKSIGLGVGCIICLLAFLSSVAKLLK